jgi:hypothetical protein
MAFRGRLTFISAALLSTTMLVAVEASAQTAVATYHNDNARSAWNSTETALNYTTVPGAAPGQQLTQLFTISLDAVAFSQPLVVPKVVVTGDPNPGTHDVTYIATYNNTIYAIDPTRGTTLLTRNLGPVALDPCNVRGPAGINGTPVINLATKTMFVIAHPLAADGVTPQYVLHALDLGTLADKVPPVVITATAKLSDGSLYTFSAPSVRQRPALIESNGAIYAGFGGSCDVSTPGTPGRGWVLGWHKKDLSPLPFAELTDQDATEPNNFFHTAIWMSGAGLAGDSDGDIYFITGNSDPSGVTYSRQYNITESVAKMNGATGKIMSTFTPMDYPRLDQIDRDFGSGGITLLPDIAGSPPMAVAAGKNGDMYLLNRNGLGGYTPAPGPDNVLGTYFIDHCACTESVFQNNGNTYVVSSGGNTIGVWQVMGGKTPSLTLIGSSAALPNSDKMQGYFTTVTSNGSADPIIWVVTRPVAGGDLSVNLVAIQALPNAGSTVLQTLYSAVAGAWTYRAAQGGTNANITPVVANGRIYVASDHEMTIFGLSGG